MWKWWLVAFVVFSVLEVLTPFFFFLSLGVASLVIVFVDLFITDSMSVQMTSFIVLSALFVLLSRKFYHKVVKNAPDASVGPENYIGKTAKVVAVKSEDEMVVKVDGEEWLAFVEGEGKFSVGDRVIVKRVEGVHFVVGRGENE